MQERTRKRLRAVVFAAGFVLIGIGTVRGEIGTVFVKATMICLECIGIG